MAADSTDSPDDDFIDPYDGPSKSQLKREALAVRDLGVELVKLTATQLEKIPLPDDIRAAVEQAQRIKAHGGRRRQLQYIGKLLRQLDTEPIATALTDLQSGAVIAKRELHWLEQTRDALIAGEDGALDGIFDRYPQAERQHLRRLIEKARREQARNRPPATSREIFRYLRDLMQSS
ncbi:MAG: DUF615 domain-containing protein [Candidatus Competibacteraceae bacterium]|nr:DUF615 domain-containing protein [Candidatus Competibacteraceae bacterium]